MSNKNSYWKKRLQNELKAKQAKERDVEQEMSSLYRVHQANIEKEIQSFYQRYADAEGVSVAEAKKRADEMDIQAFADKAKRYVEEKNFSPEANAELKLYNLKMRVSRAELLQYNMDLELLALGQGEQKLTEKFLKDGFVDEMKSQAGILGEYIQNPQTVAHAMQGIINAPFEGATWSKRIWDRQQALRLIVAQTAQETLLRGRNAMTMIPKIRQEFGVSKSAAKRLVVTETARVQTEAQKASMEANGFDEYEFIAEPSACPICARLNGKVFKVSDMEPGKNSAPIHPHCHCSTAPHADREKMWKEIDKIMNSDVETSQDPLYNKGERASGAIYGAWNDENDPLLFERDRHARMFYESIRNRDKQREIEKVANNAGFSKSDVEKVFNHIFINEYALDEGQKRFDPSYDMSESWRRLSEGKEIQKHDITLLHHELHEYGLMQEGYSYRTAHAMTNELYNYQKDLEKWKKRKG